MPIKVHGVDALSEPFTERTTTVMVSCHGCKYQSKHYVPKGSIVTLEIPRRNPNAPVRIITGNVIWVQRPSQAQDLLHIGLEFVVAGNVWDTPSAPEDWFPLPGEPAFEEEIVDPGDGGPRRRPRRGSGDSHAAGKVRSTRSESRRGGGCCRNAEPVTSEAGCGAA